MERIESIKKEIEKLHSESSDECMKEWWYEGHVLSVANYAEEIAQKVGANVEIAVLAALFHDIARIWDVWNEPELMNESLSKAEEIMTKHEYSADETEQVKQTILHHSCKEQLPETEEGKVLATADALAHLLTDFYLILPFYGWLRATKDFHEYKTWVLERIERDFQKKIFYEKYKEKAREKYEAMKMVFTADLP